MSDHCPYLFVYGTLRRSSSHRMARFLEQRGRFLGEARVQGCLYNLGRYPGLTPSSEANDLVVGDVYDLLQPEEMLRELDQYEGTHYVRQLTPVRLASGQMIQAWIYWYRATVDESQRIENGDYFG